MITLRPDQNRAVDQARAELAKGHTQICMVGPTGVGKSVIAAHIARCHLDVDPSHRVLVIAHRRELIGQLAGKLRGAGLSCGEIHPGATPFPARAQVASIQTLVAREARPEATLIIWDEAHHIVAATWATVRDDYPKAILLGFTATPMLATGDGLGAAFTTLVVMGTVKELTAQGILVPCETIGPERTLLPGELAQDPVEAYKRHPGERAFLFAPSVELAVQYACRFRENGVRSVAILGEMNPGLREQSLRDFAAGHIQVITNVATMTEGVDVPAATTCILARRVGHAGLFLQMVGRVLRSAPGKTTARLIDLCGSVHVHGLPDEDRIYSLDGRGIRRPQDLIDVRFCPVCGSIVTDTECPECGHSGDMRRRPPRVLGLPMTRFAHLRRDTPEQQAERLSRWLETARQNGRKDGHALYKFKHVYGGWPAGGVRQLAEQLLRTRPRSA